MLVEETVLHLQEDNYLETTFVDEIFAELVKKLHQAEMYSSVAQIAGFVSDDEIIRSDCAFYCAYAFGEEPNNRALILYEKLVEKEPHNSSALNNIGVQYRDQGNLYKALLCYEKACQLDPQKELYIKNIKNIKESISKQIQDDMEVSAANLSMESLRQIGYTPDLCKKIYAIRDEALREIIHRDLRECAIAVIMGQDKLATIMCGSIAEALLLYQVKEKGITKYDVHTISHRRDAANCPVAEMVLNELLYVAREEQILDKADHHLGHYLKNYRNMVHPAREIREKENVTHENTCTMFSVLVRLISTLFPG